MDCENCGSPLSSDDYFCGNCGMPTKDSTERSVEGGSEFSSEKAVHIAFGNLDLKASGKVPGRRVKPSGQRLLRLLFTLSILALIVISIFGFVTDFRGLWQISSATVLLGLILRLCTTFYYKTYVEAVRRHKRRIQIIERIGSDAVFAREAIQAFRLTSDSSDGYLSPDAASSVEDDPFLKSTWKDAHQELQHLYAVLGPPPMKSLMRTRDG